MKSLPLGLMACAIILLGLYITLAGTNASHPQGVSPRQDNSSMEPLLVGASTAPLRQAPAEQAESASLRRTRLELGLPAELRLTLVDAENRPIEGARVRVERPDSTTPLALGERRSAANGRVTCSLESGHALSVALGGGSWASRMLDVAPLLPGEVRDLGTHSLVKGGSIRVSVLENTGTPSPGAQLGLLQIEAPPVAMLLRTVAELRTPWNRIPTAVCSSAGTYRFRGLAPGYYQIVARSGASSASETKGIVTVASGAESQLTLRLDHSVAARGWSGRVVDASGTPVAYALVDAVHPTGQSGGWTWTDEQGRFELRPTPGAIELRASARAGSARFGLEGLDVSDVEIRLSTGFELTVLARSETGEPIARALVKLARWTGDGLDDAHHLQAWTDTRGVAVWRGLEAGEWRVGVSAPYHERRSRELQWNGRTGETVEVVLAPAGCLRIRLLDANGDALPHVPLRLRAELGDQPGSPRSTTDLAGWVAWNELATGKYAVFLDDVRPKVARARTGESPLGLFEVSAGSSHDSAVQLSAMAAVRVRVLRDREPVRSARVGLCRADELDDLAWQQFTQQCARTTDADGYVTLLAPAAGAYTLFVSSAPGAPSQLVSLQLRPGSQERDVTLSGASLSGHVAAIGLPHVTGAMVLLAPKTEVPGLEPFVVSLQDEEGRRSQVRFQPGEGRALTDATGRFSIADVPAGVYRVEISADGFVSASFDDVTIERGSIDLGLVELLPLRDLHVEVRDFELSHTAPMELVRARLHSDEIDQVVTSKSGSFSFASVIPGAHQLDVRWGERQFSGTVVVSPTDTNHIVIELTP